MSEQRLGDAFAAVPDGTARGALEQVYQHADLAGRALVEVLEGRDPGGGVKSRGEVAGLGMRQDQLRCDGIKQAAPCRPRCAVADGFRFKLGEDCPLADGARAGIPRRSARARL